MDTTILSDVVINSTQFRNDLSRWFKQAYNSPVSIMNKKKLLVLLNREYAKNMYQLNHYAGLVVQFCQEQNVEKSKMSDTFPWVKYLDEKSIAEFRTELFLTFDKALHSRDSSMMD